MTNFTESAKVINGQNQFEKYTWEITSKSYSSQWIELDRH